MTHGTTNGYKRGCRCDDCKAANSAYQKAFRARLQSRELPDRIHGTTYGYRYAKCRCDACKQAVKTEKAERLAAGNFKHGGTGYSYGCRCRACTAANYEYQQAHLKRLAS